MTAEQIAAEFHETYERLAPQFGYETREETRQFDPDSPNGKLMIAVCRAIIPVIQADEREECAKIVDEYGVTKATLGPALITRKAIATAIRERNGG